MNDCTPAVRGIPTPINPYGFFARASALLSNADQVIAWWGKHRGWPANEPIRIETK